MHVFSLLWLHPYVTSGAEVSIHPLNMMVSLTLSVFSQLGF
jgi:hypothetical protein